jgi:hypothetical protein
VSEKDEIDAIRNAYIDQRKMQVGVDWARGKDKTVYWSTVGNPEEWTDNSFWFPYAERLCRFHPLTRWIVFTYAKFRFWLKEL